MSPSALVAFARLSLLGRIFLKAVPAFLLLFRSLSVLSLSGWFAALKVDLAWLATSEQYSANSEFALHEWFDVVESDPRQYLRNLRRWVRSAAASSVRPLPP